MRKLTLSEKCQACKDGDINQLQAWEDAGKLESLSRPPILGDNEDLRLEIIEREAAILNQRLTNTKHGYPIEFAIGFGQLKVLEWTNTHSRFDRSIDYWAIICAIVSDQEAILQWLINERELSIDHSMSSGDITLGSGLSCDQLVMIAVTEAIRTKKLAVIQWLLRTWEKMFERNEFEERLCDIFLYAVQHGHLDLVKWIATSGGYDYVLSLCGIDAFRAANARKQRDVLEWIILYSGKSGERIIEEIKFVHSTTREDAKIAVLLKPIVELLEANVPLEKIQRYPKTVQMLRDRLLTVEDIYRLTEIELEDLQNSSREITKIKW